jgi:hypothetical protein
MYILEVFDLVPVLEKGYNSWYCDVDSVLALISRQTERKMEQAFAIILSPLGLSLFMYRNTWRILRLIIPYTHVVIKIIFAYGWIG